MATARRRSRKEGRTTNLLTAYLCTTSVRGSHKAGTLWSLQHPEEKGQLRSLQAMTKQSPGGKVHLCEPCGELGFACSFAVLAG